MTFHFSSYEKKMKFQGSLWGVAEAKQRETTVSFSSGAIPTIRETKQGHALPESHAMSRCFEKAGLLLVVGSGVLRPLTADGPGGPGRYVTYCRQEETDRSQRWGKTEF